MNKFEYDEVWYIWEKFFDGLRGKKQNPLVYLPNSISMFSISRRRQVSRFFASDLKIVNRNISIG